MGSFVAVALLAVLPDQRGDGTGSLDLQVGLLLLGCEQIGTSPARTIYVGDALRDIEAGRVAGMTTIAATYGYIMTDDEPKLWGADQMAANTKELAKILRKAVNLSV